MVTLAGLALAAGPAGAAAPTLRLTILHVVSHCHVWATASLRELGASTTLSVKPGTRVVVRPDCPMDFVFVQTKGPKVALGDPLTHAGTQRVLVFRRAGLYVFKVKNVQTPEEVGLQVLGEANTLTLRVRVG